MICMSTFVLICVSRAQLCELRKDVLFRKLKELLKKKCLNQSLNYPYLDYSLDIGCPEKSGPLGRGLPAAEAVPAGADH